MFENSPDENDEILIDANLDEKVDFSIEDGTYKVRVAAFERQLSKMSGEPQLVVTFVGLEDAAADMIFKKWYRLGDTGRSMLIKDFNALGVPKRATQFVITRENIVGKVANATIGKAKPYTNRDGQNVITSQIKFLTPCLDQNNVL